MKNKINLIFIISLFVILLVPLSAEARLDNIEVGDTFYYEVTEFNLPLLDIANATGDADEAFLELLGGLTFDLTGSTLAVKVMDTYDDGLYVLNAFVILGKSITVPYPDGTPQELLDIFGDDITVPEGVGIGLGFTIPGSDFLDVFMAGAEAEGLPFYIDPAGFDDFQTLIEDELGSNPNVTALVTNEDGSDFSLDLSGDTGGDPDVTIQIIVEWFNTGDNAGLFKSIDLNVETTLNDKDISIDFKLEYSKEEHHELPDEILTMETITLAINKAAFNYTTTGIFDNEQVTDGLVEIQDALASLVGTDLIEYDVSSVHGLYYETHISTYNPETETLEPTGDSVWWNGFTGFPVTDQSAENLAENLNYTNWSPSVGVIPLLAPGITSDWDMWIASTKSIGSIVSIYETILNSGTAISALEDFGITVNQFDITYEVRSSGDFNFFYLELVAEAGFDAATFDAENVNASLPDYFGGNETVDISLNANVWLSYTQNGLIAGFGVDADFSLDFANIPFYDEDSDTYMDQDGGISLDLDFEVANTDFEDIPDASLAAPIGGGGDGGGDFFSDVPGFDAIPVLMVMASIGLIILKKKQRNA